MRMQNATVLLVISVIAPAQQSQQTLSTALRALDSATKTCCATDAWLLRGSYWPC